MLRIMLLLTRPFGVISCQQKSVMLIPSILKKIKTVLRFSFYKSKWLWARV